MVERREGDGNDNELPTELPLQLNQLMKMKKYDVEKMNTPTFRRFLQAFGVKGMDEFKNLTDEEQQICVREYLKDLPNLVSKKLQRCKN